MRPWDPLFDFVFVDCLAQVAACEIHHQSWCWSVFVFFFGAPQCRCFKWFSSFYQGYIRYISYKLSLLYLIVNCGVPILGESSSSLEEWRSLLGQSGCHGGERFSKEIWGQGVPWAETYGVFVLICWLRVPIFGWMFLVMYFGRFPTLIWFESQKRGEYTGGRTTQTIVDWVRSM